MTREILSPNCLTAADSVTVPAAPSGIPTPFSEQTPGWQNLLRDTQYEQDAFIGEKIRNIWSGSAGNSMSTSG